MNKKENRTKEKGSRKERVTLLPSIPTSSALVWGQKHLQRMFGGIFEEFLRHPSWIMSTFITFHSLPLTSSTFPDSSVLCNKATEAKTSLQQDPLPVSYPECCGPSCFHIPAGPDLSDNPCLGQPSHQCRKSTFRLLPLTTPEAAVFNSC